MGGMGGMPGMGGMGGAMGGGMGGGGMPGNPFGGSEEKLMANPRIAKYFEDPQFKMKWEKVQQRGLKATRPTDGEPVQTKM